MGTGCQLRVVSHHHDRLSCITEGNQQTQDILADLRIQVTRWLVGKQDGGAVDQGPGDRHPLPLASG